MESFKIVDELVANLANLAKNRHTGNSDFTSLLISLLTNSHKRHLQCSVIGEWWPI